MGTTTEEAHKTAEQIYATLEEAIANLTIVEGTKEDSHRVTPGPDDSEDDDDGNDLNDIEPFDLWRGGGEGGTTQDDDDYFTNDELINVLRSFEVEEDDRDVQCLPLEFPTGEVLPELEFETDDDALLLTHTEFTSSIFYPSDDDDDDDRTVEEKKHDSESTEQQQVDRQLLEAFQNLIVGVDEGLQCQPCSPDPDTNDDDQGVLLWNPNTEIELTRFDEDRPPLPEKEFDAILLEEFQNLTLLGGDPSLEENAKPDTVLESAVRSIVEDPPALDPSPKSSDLRQLYKRSLEASQEELDSHLQYLLNLEDGGNPLPSEAGEGGTTPPYLSETEIEEGGNPYLSEAEMDSLFEQGATVGRDYSEDDYEDEDEDEDEDIVYNEPFNISQRPEALEAAGNLLEHFQANAAGLENERLCLGHQETIFGTAFSECGNYMATAGQDSTVRIWDVAKNSPLTTLTEHRTDYECLRVAWASSQWSKETLNRGKDSSQSWLVASAGADGSVKVWASKDPKEKGSWTCCATIDHTAFDRILVNPDDDAEKPQVYAVQWIDHWSGLPTATEKSQNSFLLSSSDDFVHLWELEPKTEDSTDLSFREVMSLHFTSYNSYGYGVSIGQVTKGGLGIQSSGFQSQANAAIGQQRAFGGERNPNNLLFTFDAAYCPANGLLGVALSDGSLRLINGRGICISIMTLPGCKSHLTAFSWDSTGTRLATCVAIGQVILWGVTIQDGVGGLSTTCSAILEGGHEPGRPVFGARFFADGENLLLTWGIDGRLCVWDSYSVGNIHAPVTTLVSNPDYPIYSVDVQSSCIAAGGGGRESSFVGIPVNLYDTAGTGD